MEKRLIVFLILSLAIIFAYPFFMEQMIGPTPQAPEVTQAPMETTPKSAPSSSTQEGASVGEPVVEEKDAKEKIIESDLYRIVLSNIGGTVKEWQLKKYTEKTEAGGAAPIELLQEDVKTLPLTVFTEEEPNGSKQLYSLDEKTVQLSPENPMEVVTLTAVGPDGRKITKELTFHNDHYLVDTRIATEGYTEGYKISLGTNFGINNWAVEFGGSIGAATFVNNEMIKNAESDISGAVAHEGEVLWTALQDKYFISALIPKEVGQMNTVTVEKEGAQQIRVDLKIPAEQAGQKQLGLYAGPKEYDRLAQIGAGLQESIDFGWFIMGSWAPVRFVAKPIYFILRFFYQFTHNYGVAIILVTVLVKVLFFPITRKSLASMKDMAAIQPKVAALRKKYAGDREKMNRELMNLYKEHQINPFGGCLPMLAQIPVFISLFNVLYTTIDLRQAPFMFWIQDLSDKDPFYVLPVIMGISMFFQQWTQPTTMDPMQAKIMLFLPVIYTFFFLNFPSGLVLYWLVNNILTIGQQYLMNREGLAIPKAGTT
ncbi:membrane protein insertase YidC [Candidatus Manganitrophus noduliformans]|uniref:Membrane protein insertase YidC n=1 Tax=Candidatus Manganitrophus noduliformans TaxID=2606439 RepID=A0A7X6I9M2_9BACT|nr:membrane protein insertase YidC [Candidatus Manganitrophus noduliformans]NKE69520.1 membrane protein insertase YidC [Candidatus Manganitrophus noduliformans]